MPTGHTMTSPHLLRYEPLTFARRAQAKRWWRVRRGARWLVALALLVLLAFMPRFDRATREQQVRSDSAQVLAAAKKSIVVAAPGPPGAPVVGPMAQSLAAGKQGVVLEID